jgi:hypothetical protein
MAEPKNGTFGSFDIGTPVAHWELSELRVLVLRLPRGGYSMFRVLVVEDVEPPFGDFSLSPCRKCRVDGRNQAWVLKKRKRESQCERRDYYSVRVEGAEQILAYVFGRGL